jgi:hypothetical protein
LATKRKRWFKAADSLSTEPWTNDELAFAVRLMGMLNTRWAREGKEGEEVARVTLRPTDLASLAGCASPVRASRIANAWAVHTSGTIRQRGANYAVEWRKYAVFQGWLPEIGAVAGHLVSDQTPSPKTQTQTHSKTQTQKEEESADALDCERLVNVLGKEPGTREEKLTWLKDEIVNIDLIIAEEMANGKVKPEARMAAIRSRVLRHYRHKVQRISSDKGKSERRLYTIDETREAALRREKEAAAAQESMTCEDCGAPALKRKARRWLCDECYEAA